MKFLIGLGLWFTFAWMPQFFRSWYLWIKCKFEQKHMSENDLWVYDV